MKKPLNQEITVECTFKVWNIRVPIFIKKLYIKIIH